jgi:predicted NBD/HSP70 family sugar kinase
VVQPTAGVIRATNRAAVVDVLRRAGSATRAELMARTGLSRATVSSLVGELQARGLVSEDRRVRASGSGRPSSVLSLNRSAGLAIAVDVGVRHVGVAVGDLSRRVLAERWVPLPHGHSADTGVSLVLRCIEETMAEVDECPEQVVGAAVGIAAPIAPQSGRMLVPGVLPGWNGPHLAERIAARWGIPVVVENDANLGALAESTWGEFAGAPDLLYVKVASRIGLGIVLDGSIHHGRDGFAGEFGHVTAVPDGAPCWCGRRGCLELYVGGEGVRARLREAGVDVADTADLVRLALQGAPGVRSVLSGSAELLARGLATLALLFNPSAIVLGGELAALGDLLLDPVRAELATIRFGSPVRVLGASLGDRASLIGALALVLAETSRFTDRSVHLETRPTTRTLSGTA